MYLKQMDKAMSMSNSNTLIIYSSFIDINTL